MSEENPVHKHDCDRCIFLGGYYDKANDQLLDMYVCPLLIGEKTATTVIGRWGVDGQYFSGINFVGNIPVLTEAWERAADMGYKPEFDSELNNYHKYLGDIT